MARIISPLFSFFSKLYTSSISGNIIPLKKSPAFTMIKSKH
ncbi:hypothetical protein [Fusobacterium pseudoperiodonticum]|nr:hypothetical protein [Fusobacterium pseudoperiodonticum]